MFLIYILSFSIRKVFATSDVLCYIWRKDSTFIKAQRSPASMLVLCSDKNLPHMFQNDVLIDASQHTQALACSGQDIKAYQMLPEIKH